MGDVKIMLKTMEALVCYRRNVYLCNIKMISICITIKYEGLWKRKKESLRVLS